MRSLITFVTICFTTACATAEPQGSTCLQLWQEFGVVEESLVCADHQGEPDEEFIVYAFPGASVELTDVRSFQIVGSFDVKGMTQPGEFVEIECPIGVTTYLCTEWEPHDGLFIMGATSSLFQIWFGSVEVEMLCVYHDLD